MPVMQLNSVVLPAPFGPMSANTWPVGTSKLTLSTATRPPKRLVRPWTRRMLSISALQLAWSRQWLVFGGLWLLLADLGRRKELRAQKHDPDQDQPEYHVLAALHHLRDSWPAVRVRLVE